MKTVTWRERPLSRKRVSRLLISDLDAALSSGVSLGTGSVAEGNNIMYVSRLALGNNSLKFSKICSRVAGKPFNLLIQRTIWAWKIKVSSTKG